MTNANQLRRTLITQIPDNSYRTKRGLTVSYGEGRHGTRKPVLSGAREIALSAAAACEEKLATDTVVLDIAELCTFASFFVITTATNTRLLQTVVEFVQEKVKEELGDGPLGIEGQQEWVVVDYGGTIVHVFSKEAREFYQLERLWGDAGNVPLTSRHEQSA